MNDLQKYEPPYQWPTSLPATPGALTPFQKAQREIEFANHPAFQNRRIVTIVVVALSVGLIVADVLRDGINRTAAFATVVALIVAYCVMNYTTPKHSGTKQNFYKP